MASFGLVKTTIDILRAKNSHGKEPRTYTIVTLPHPSP